jgi:hypothetical protein
MDRIREKESHSDSRVAGVEEGGKEEEAGGDNSKVPDDEVVEEEDDDEDDEDDDDDDDDDDDEDFVKLGMVEKPDVPEALKPEYFPSKVGGKPAWLNPEVLPSSEMLRCEATPHGELCGRQLVFALQVYAPMIDGAPECFHRSLFLFCCRNKTCSGKQGSAKVFRSQLPRKNEFYSYEPPEYPTAGPKITMIQEEEEARAAEDEGAMSDPAVTEALDCKTKANELFKAEKVVFPPNKSCWYSGRANKGLNSRGPCSAENERNSFKENLMIHTCRITGVAEHVIIEN